MKIFFSTLFACIFTLTAFSQQQGFRFAFLSDTHIGSPNGGADEDLRRSVRDINAMSDVKFVVLTGDITELGTNEELALAKRILDSLHIPYYIIPGNHDTGWSESGGMMFGKTFGSDRFHFEYNGIHFLGCASGPYVRMSDGHVPRDAVNWLKDELRKLPTNTPVIFLNHYPIDPQLDNWYEITDELRKYNTLAILCGHGHQNKAFSFDGIPAVMGRSNLRAKEEIGGYNLVDVRADSILFNVKRPGNAALRKWTGIAITKGGYTPQSFPRPDFRINDTFSTVKQKWIYQSASNVISTPAVTGNKVIFGNQGGTITAINLINGQKIWEFETGGAIFSSPAFTKDRLVVGSANGNVYCLSLNDGKKIWEHAFNAAVLGSPLIDDKDIYIGGSDHSFRKLKLKDGKEEWSFNGLEGPVVSLPVLADDKVIFGAWDRNLYALNEKDGTLAWKWNNGSAIRNYSPAACIPVVHDQVVYVVAPDRYISAIDINNGQLLWRNNDATVRESIGISNDGNYIYGKTMQDTVVAYHTSRDKQFAAWKLRAGFGYEHVPSMLIEKEQTVFFGTRSGVVYAIDPRKPAVKWAHKIDNSMVNTVNVIDGKHVVAATMDGRVVLLEEK